MEENNETGSVIITNEYGDVCMRKQRRKRQKALIQEMLYEYATDTTLHGLAYTTRRGLTVIEKAFWIITFVTSFLYCSYLINNVWIKWKTCPVIVTISETLVPVREIPFPSVTICPQSKVKISVYNYASEQTRLLDIVKNRRREILDNALNFSKLDDISQICGNWRIHYELKPDHLNLDYKVEQYKLEEVTAAENIISVAPKKEDIFVSCKWHGRRDENCAKSATEVLTHEGLCYNINSLAAEDILQGDNNIHITATKNTINWSMTHGYTYFGPHADPYPVPGKEFGASPDLEIVFKDITTELDENCNTVNSGFNKVYVQHPTDLPQTSLYYYVVRNGELSSMALSYNIINTSKTLEKYTSEQRQCYFPTEYYLKYFKIYTERNCMMECLTNITYQNCDCVAFYMPHENNTKICNSYAIDCINEARDLKYALTEELVMREARKDESACRCLPPCYSVEYQAEILKTNFNLSTIEGDKDLKFLKQTSSKRNTGVFYSKMEMFFKGSRFVSMHRSELFGVTDFLANIGGLLGLFLGFSFLSLVELAYFLTLRLSCLLKKDMKQEKLKRKNTIKINPAKY